MDQTKKDLAMFAPELAVSGKATPTKAMHPT